MELRRTFASLDKLGRRFFVPFLLSGPVRCDRKHIQVTQLARFLLPQWLERVCRIGPALGEKVTEAQQMARLQGAWLIAHDRFKIRYSFKKVVLPEICQAN